MIKQEFNKCIEDNIQVYIDLDKNKMHFTEYLRDKYPDIKKKLTLEGVRARVKAYFKENGEPEVTFKAVDVVTELKTERQLRAMKSQLNDAKNKNEALLLALDEAERNYDDLLRIKEPVEILNVEPSGKSSLKKSRATPIILFSDWHLEENIERGIVNGYNEYNLKIAEQRVFTVVKNALKLIAKESQDTNITDAVLWFGGDSISGFIHDELIQNNNLSPLEAIRMSKRLHIWAIEYILKNTKLKLIIPCSVGNHSRSTKKMQASTGYKNNYEYMMYMDLQDLYQINKRVEFHVPISDDCYVQIFGKTNRFFHGDAVKYGGGIGGLSIPLTKYLMRKDAQMKADHTFMGHFHTLGYIHGMNCCVNGSLIGLSAYGYKIGFKPEVPAQAFTLLDEKRGYTVKTPIFAV